MGKNLQEKAGFGKKGRGRELGRGGKALFGRQLSICGLGKIAWPVVEFQLHFPQLGINYLDLDAPIGAVASLVCWRVGDEVLFAQVTLNLIKSDPQLAFASGKISPPSGLLSNLFK